jgi:hypothetical protein
MKPLRVPSFGLGLFLALAVGLPLQVAAQHPRPSLAEARAADAPESALPAAPQPADSGAVAHDTADPAAPPAGLLDAFTVTGQVRHRSELDRRSGIEPPSLHLLRTRLNLSFRPSEDVTGFVQVQDARLFGGGDPAAGRGTLDGRAPALDLHQAYFAVTHLLGAPLRLKVGRQELAYGNQRLIGSVGWSNVGGVVGGALGYKRVFLGAELNFLQTFGHAEVLFEDKSFSGFGVMPAVYVYAQY